MAKKSSTCMDSALEATLNVLPEDAFKITATYLKENLGEYLSVSGKQKLNRVEAIGVTAAETGKRIQQLDKAPEKFDSFGNTVATQKNTQMYTRDVGLEGLVSHHTLAVSNARIAGQVRSSIPSSKTGKSLAPEFIARVSAGEAALRVSGIPVVIHKAVVQSGPMHYSFLGTGDIGRVFVQTGNSDLFGMAVLRSGNPSENIQFQNLAEAARRVIEESATNPEKLADSVRDALTNTIGKPVNAKAKTAVENAMAWTTTSEGSKVVNDLVKAMTDPKFVKALVAEDSKMAAVTIALARADGTQMAAKTLETVADLTKQGEKLKGYSYLLMDNGIDKLFGNDALVNLTPDKLNLAFAQQANALFFSKLDDESLAVVAGATRKIRGADKDAKKAAKTGKPSKTGLNAAKKAENDDITEAATKQVTKEMNENADVRNMESSLEASSIARQIYLENYYGSVVGGLAKAISKVSDIATMGKDLKTRLVGVEHLRLENAAIMTSNLRKFADRYGQDIPKFNEVFRMLQTSTDDTLEATLAGLKGVDKQIADEMLFFIDNIYGMGEWNKLMREGVHADEMINSLKLVGQTKQAAFFESRKITDTAAAKDFWKELELGDGDNVIEILSKYYSAIQLSMIKPQLAESAVRYFGHKADGLTRAEAIKQGYKSVSPENGLSQFLAIGDEPPLFHPEIIGKLQSLNHYLEFSKGFKSEGIQKAINKLDPIVGVLKSSITIWRPGHHVTSMMGNAFANMLAGVFESRHYAMALKTMKQYKMIDDLDEGALAEIAKTNIPEGYVFKGAEDGVKIALRDPKTGKIKEYTLDYDGIGKGATAIAGVRITPRRAKDVVDNELQQGTVTNALMKNPLSKGVQAIDGKLATLAAARDNVFRYALFIKELEKGGPYGSLDEAFQKAGAKVHEFHPTVGTLTAEERKYARRLFYFYTWQKQAFFKILELTANSPAVITVPSKVQFAIAEANALNPESFGKPYDPTQLYASYNTNSVYGPQTMGEFGPEGIKPAITQLDVFDSYFSQFQTKAGAGAWENIGNALVSGAKGIVAKNMTPLVRIPAELLTGNKLDDGGKITDVPQYLLDQTGLSSPSRATGVTPWGQRSDYKEGGFAEANRERQAINYWLGVKYTYYQSPVALDRARQERLEYFKRINQNGETK